MLRHLLSPKVLSARARPLGKTENRVGRLVLFTAIGAVFWAFAFGVLYGCSRISARARDRPLLAGKLLGLILIGFFSILLLSNIITALSSFFLARDLDLLVVGAGRLAHALYGAKLLETCVHSSWMVVLMAVPMFAAYGVVYDGGSSFRSRRRGVRAVSDHPGGDRERDHAAAREHVSGAAHAGHPQRHRGARRRRGRRAVPARAAGAARASGRVSVAGRLHRGAAHADVAVAAERVGAAQR